MLIVNLHTLQTVYVLDFIYDIFLNGRRTFDSQDISRSDSTIRQRSSGTYVVIFLNQNLLRQCNQVLTYITCLGSHDDFTVTTFDLTHCYLTIDFRYDCRVRRVTSFKQLSYSRKTTGDITSLTNGTRNLHQNITCFHGLLVFYDYVTTYRQVVCTDNSTILIQNVQRRNLVLILRFSDDDFTQTCSFIGFYLVSDIFNHRFKVNLTGSFCYDNGVERVPLRNQLALFYDFTV